MTNTTIASDSPGTTDSWSTSYLAGLSQPDAGIAFLPQPRSFSHQTLWQTVRLRRGGRAIRVVLSNEFGQQPLRIGEITVDGGRFPRPVLLEGATAWLIAPGAQATSDPVPLPVGAGDEITIRMFVAGETGPASYLPSAQRTMRITPGNGTAAPAGAAEADDAETAPSLFWVTRVLVDEPAAGPVVVALGDSITRGDGSTADRDQRYPDHLQRRLVAEGGPAQAGSVVLNAGISGNRLLTPRIGPAMTDRFERDVLNVAEATHVLMMAGINDIGLPSALRDGTGQPSGAELFAGLRSLATRAQERGITPVLGSVTPFAGTIYTPDFDPHDEEIRQELNQAIAAQRDWAWVDFAAAVADAADPSRLASVFDSGDGIHLSDAGNAALAAAVDLSVLQLA